MEEVVSVVLGTVAHNVAAEFVQVEGSGWLLSNRVGKSVTGSETLVFVSNPDLLGFLLEIAGVSQQPM